MRRIWSFQIALHEEWTGRENLLPQGVWSGLDWPWPLAGVPSPLVVMRPAGMLTDYKYSGNSAAVHVEPVSRSVSVQSPLSDGTFLLHERWSARVETIDVSNSDIWIMCLLFTWSFPIDLARTAMIPRLLKRQKNDFFRAISLYSIIP